MSIRNIIGKMNKKAQIAVFVLLGLILLIGFSFVSYLKNNQIKETEIEKSTNLQFDIFPIKLYIENCLESTGKNALIHIGKQGGYYELKKPYLKDENFNLPYYIHNSLDFSPSLNDIEREISKYINNNLELCINNFEEFKKQGFDITYSSLITNTIIEKESASLDIHSPLTIKKGDITTELKDFEVNINIPLGKINNVSKKIINFQLQNPNTICLTCLYDLAEESNLYIDVVKYQNNSLIFDVRYYNITEDNLIKSSYNFTFAINLLDISCDNFIQSDDTFFVERCVEERIKNTAQEIQIEDIPNLQTKVSEKLYYKVNVFGNGLVFSDYSELFNITSDGVINFIPNLEQIGNYSTWISVKDVLGNEKFKNFNIEVIE